MATVRWLALAAVLVASGGAWWYADAEIISWQYLGKRCTDLLGSTRTARRVRGLTARGCADGSVTGNTNAGYGTKGVLATGHEMGARNYHHTWVSNSGNNRARMHPLHHADEVMAMVERQ